MGDTIGPVSDAQAKAVTAIAKTTGKVVDAVSDLGRFVGRVLGTLPEDAVGLLGADWISHVRTRNSHRLQVRTDEILASRNVEIEPLSLSVARPLLEAAQDESRDELVELWARLLANAVDGTRPPVRRSFIDTLRALDSIDARILERTDKESRHGHAYHDQWPEAMGISKDEMLVSLRHLQKLDCLDCADEFQLGVRSSLGRYHILSAYGRELMRAVSL